MGLTEYRRKRNFKKTPEPAPGRGGAEAKDIFVVQKHAASHVHYDLRLRVGDVLASWAIPKGPSLDPREKRLAIRTEDHPVGYAAFEGVIPEGEYGGGTVMIWDRGRWSVESGDAGAALKEGMIKFRLEGERLKGRWMLVRTKRDQQWLLVKERDGEASPGVHAETFATSVASGRTMEEVAAGRPARKMVKEDRLSADSLKGARRGAMPQPGAFRPQLAETSAKAPEGDEWFHEVKFDGYRFLIYRTGRGVQIMSRNGQDWTERLPDVAKAVEDRVAGEAVLDGEAVILDTRGVSDFQALQNAIHNRRSKSIVFFAFDLPWCDGWDLTGAALESRRGLLAQLTGARQEGRLRFSEHVVGNGAAALERVCKAGLEGIVSKRRGSTYVQSRSVSWLKVKCFNQQEFVIGGMTEPEGSREQFGALLLGYHDERGLRYAGKVGTGFSTETLRKLAATLRPLAQARPAFVDPPTGAEARGVMWLKPRQVAQVQFRGWTEGGTIRHPSFRGLREDRDAERVTREAGVVAERGTRARVERGAKSSLRLTHPERVVFPDRGAGYSVTKRQVAEYYEAVAAFMMPHIVDRPLAVVRLPSGEGTKAFFQKHPAKGMPKSVSSVEVVDETGRKTAHMVVRDVEGLMALVQLNAIEFHPWGSRAGAIERPDRLVFDLDPGEDVPWKETVGAAKMVREALAQVKLRAFARTTGGKGIHIVVPVEPVHTWEETTGFCRAVAETLARMMPRRLTATAAKQARGGKVYVDYLRNVRGATAVTSYSLRARPRAPVAMPVHWDELEGLGSGAAFNCFAAMKRVAGPDPWKEMEKAAAELP